MTAEALAVVVPAEPEIEEQDGSWKHTQQVWKEFCEVIDKRFDYDLKLWEGMRLYKKERPSWWKDERGACVNSFCRLMLIILGKALTGHEFQYFHEIPDEQNKKFQHSVERLVDLMDTNDIINWRLDSVIRHEASCLWYSRECGVTVEEADVVFSQNPDAFRNAKKTRKPRFSKKQTTELQLQQKPPQNEHAFKCPVHPYPKNGTSLWLIDKTGKLVTAEVIDGKLVKSIHEQEILITSGEFIGAFSHYPSSIVTLILGSDGHLNGWLVIRKHKDDNGGEISAQAKALTTSGECYQIKKSSVKKPHLSGLTAGLPVIPIPSDDMLVPLDIPRGLILLVEKEAPTLITPAIVPVPVPAEQDEVLPTDTVQLVGTEDVTAGMDGWEPETSASGISELSTMSILQKLQDKRRQLGEDYGTGKISAKDMMEQASALEVAIKGAEEQESALEQIGQHEDELNVLLEEAKTIEDEANQSLAAYRKMIEKKREQIESLKKETGNLDDVLKKIGV